MVARERARHAQPPQHEPEQEVPFIRDWFTPAYRTWARVMYGRRGWFIAWGWILWLIVLPYVVLKAGIFWSVVVIMLIAFFFTAMYDVLTVRRRLRAAQT